MKNSPDTAFLNTYVPQFLIVVNAILAMIYFYVIAFFFPQGNPILFWALVLGEVFHLWQALTYLQTVWHTERHNDYKFDHNFKPTVDIFITVAGEPIEIVRETATAALSMKYPSHKVYILNDSFVAKKENWQGYEELAKELGIFCITRKTPGGAKAGNINNALKETSGEYVAIFDADHIPNPDFLERTVSYFIDTKMAFVQSPQFYKNHHQNMITRGAWEQQELFFGPICKGKNQFAAATMCGTNMVISRKALEQVGGMCQESIAEDIVTGLFMHQKGWKSLYVPEVLAKGLAPEDSLSYYKQQFRWARGALDVIFRYNPMLRKGMSWNHKIQYLASASFYLSGAVVLMNALLPIIFLFTGAIPFEISTMVLATVFLPYIFMTLYIIQRSTNFAFTFRSLAFSMAGFMIHLQALYAAMTFKKSSFSVTSKKALEGNFIQLVIPHIAYIILFIIGIVVAVLREGLSASVINNITWGFIYVVIFSQFILAAIPSFKAYFLRNK